MRHRRPVPYLKLGSPKLWLGEHAAQTPHDQWPVGDAWLDGISIAYLLDLPDGKTSRYVTQGDLTKNRVPIDQLRKVSREELWNRVDRSLQVLPLENDCFGLRYDGATESSTLMLNDLWSASLAPALDGGQLVVAVPARDVVIYGSASHPYSIQHLRDVVERLWNKPQTKHPLSRNLFRWNGSWQVL